MLSGIRDRVDGLLKDDLLGSMLESLLGKPAPMRQRPMAPCTVNPPMAQQKGEQLLAFAPQIVRCRLARPDEIAHRLVNRVRHPHPSQLAGPMQPRQRHRIAPVGLDPLSWPLRDQRRSDHQAGVPASPDRPASLRISRSTVPGELDISPRKRTSPPRPPSAIATACFIFDTSNATKASLYSPMVRPPCMRLGSASPSNPRFSFARKGGPPAAARGHNV